MLEWIVIIVAIAFIFGVIKVDMLKKQWNILQPKLKELLALGTSALVAEKTEELLRIFQDNPRFILNAGCAIPPTTPAENLETMIRVARDFTNV